MRFDIVWLLEFSTLLPDAVIGDFVHNPAVEDAPSHQAVERCADPDGKARDAQDNVHDVGGRVAVDNADNLVDTEGFIRVFRK